jgi:hypothetical protein
MSKYDDWDTGEALGWTQNDEPLYLALQARKHSRARFCAYLWEWLVENGRALGIRRSKVNMGQVYKDFITE